MKKTLKIIYDDSFNLRLKIFQMSFTFFEEHILHKDGENEDNDAYQIFNLNEDKFGGDRYQVVLDWLKHEYILPDDAYVCCISQQFDRHCLAITISSKDFDVVGENQKIPLAERIQTFA